MKKLIPTLGRLVQSVSSQWGGRLALAALLLAPAVSQAAVYTYTSTAGGSPPATDGAGNWIVTAGLANQNWLLNNAGTAVVWANNNDAIIGANNGAAGQITCGTAIVVGNVTFQAPGSGNYVFSAGNIRVGGAGNHGNISTFSIPSGTIADFGKGASSGQFFAEGTAGSGLTCDGGGTLMFSYKAASTYTGPTTIQGGTTVYGGSGFLGTNVTSSLNLVSGTLGAFDSTTRIFTRPVNLKGNFTLGAPASHNGSLTFSGVWTNSGGTYTLTVDTISATINGVIRDDTSSRGLGFSSLNSGTLTLGFSGTEGYTGPTTINSGTLAVGASCNLNAASGVVIAAGGTLDVSAQTTWTAGSTASPAITASGTTTAATIKGLTTVDFGSRPITLNYDGTDDTMLTISQGALTMNGNTITINGGSTLSHGVHNIIAVTGGGITLSSTPVAIGTAIAPTDQAIVSTSGGTPNYVVVTVSAGGPLVTSPTKSSIGITTATLGANVTADNGSTITDYGIVWGTSPNPTTSNNKVQVGTTETLGAFTVPVTGLPAGTVIHYRGYAVNSVGTGYSADDSFVTITNEPTTQATTVIFPSVQGGAATISWTRGNGASCIVLVKAGSAVDSNPVDGTTYTANANFGSGSQIGSGNYVGYLGASNSVTLTALTPSTTYYVAIYELNGSAGSENYLITSPATGNQATVLHPVIYYSAAAASDPTNMGAWWTGNNGTGANPGDFLGGDTFIIQSGHTYTLGTNETWTVNATGAGTAATVQINSGGHLAYDLSSGTATLLLGGNLVQSAAGGLTASTSSGTGVVDFTSNGSWTGSGDISAIKLFIYVDSAATLTASGTSSEFKLKTANTMGFKNLNGTLDLGTNTVNANGNTNATFTLGANGTLITANTNANGLPGIFTGSFAAGKITLPTTANYVFNGAAAQVTGTTLNNATTPATVNNLTINNSVGVTLSQATTVGGALTVNASSTLDLNGLTLTVSNPPALNGKLTMEVINTGGSFTGSKLSQITGTLAYTGTLTVTATGDPLANGNIIDLFDAPAFSGSFSSTNYPVLSGGLTWSSTGLTNDGSIMVVTASTGPSGPERLTNSISGSTLSLSWPAGEGWKLQMQTNSLAKGLGTNWDYVTDGSISSTNITVDPTKPAVFYRLTYP